MLGSKRLLSAIGVIILAGCSLELRKDEDHDSAGASGTTYGGGGSESHYDEHVEKEQSCGDSSRCQEVRVFVQYALNKGLGDHRMVTIEAFNNDMFQGTPRATTQLEDFDAKTGEWREASLKLAPGDYFIRAYLTTDDTRDAAYPMREMTPVDQAPMGVYGVSSAPKALSVAYGANNDTVLISLNRLYERQGSEPDTLAKLRLALKVADSIDVPAQKLLRVELRHSADLDEQPMYAFKLSSDALRVQGHLGEAEFISPSLKEGPYVVFAFVDDDDNGYFDEGEMSAMYLENTLPKAVDIRANFTRTIALTLGK